MTDKGSSAKDGTVRQTIITILEAPRMCGVATKDVIVFKRQRDLYDKQIAEKNDEPGGEVTPTSYRESIDYYLLSIFISAEWIKAESMEDITEEQVQNCVRKRASFKPDGDDFTRIENIVRKVKIYISLKDPDERLWTLHYKYFTALQSHGLQKLPDNKPHI
ncbi:unnamed protein product [Agarophyton chilense]|eukprot:gb/GEZJ01004090.1/.p1 GENE.gb/GEZJ01004090.1/~~gb/GEZJ01004090.1/.p1  ORF type:complete len:162 (-),score=21.12 gb/GEZJ01004090.1/:2229-2714(-)